MLDIERRKTMHNLKIDNHFIMAGVFIIIVSAFVLLSVYSLVAYLFF